MNVAYVCADPGVPVFGRKGASVHVREVLKALQQRGANLTLFARRTGGDPPPGLEQIRLVQLPPVKTDIEQERELRLLASNDDLAGALASASPFDLIYERHSLWSHAAMELARERNIPGFLEINAPLIEEQATYRSLFNPDLARDSAARAICAAAAVGAVSEAVAEYARDLAPGHVGIHVVPNGVDTGRFHPDVSPALPAQPGITTVGFIGTLKPWHGIETLVEAAALASRKAPIRLLIVGDGPQRATIESMAGQLGISGFTVFTGAIDQELIPSYLASMDIAAAPYPALDRFYFSPLKLYEYMASARAIVASRIGQIETTIEHGGTGLLVPPGDAAALADTIVDLARNRAQRLALGHAARRQAIARHTWDAVAGKILHIAGLEPAGATT
jgi:glycosyltransferase involved in cell wall biosynthesis